MTRKDYVLIAQAIKAAQGDTRDGREGVKLTAMYIATMLAQDNARFDRERFMQACGFAD